MSERGKKTTGASLVERRSIGGPARELVKPQLRDNGYRSTIRLIGYSRHGGVPTSYGSRVCDKSTNPRVRVKEKGGRWKVVAHWSNGGQKRTSNLGTRPRTEASKKETCSLNQIKKKINPRGGLPCGRRKKAGTKNMTVQLMKEGKPVF